MERSPNQGWRQPQHIHAPRTSLQEEEDSRQSQPQANSGSERVAATETELAARVASRRRRDKDTGQGFSKAYSAAQNASDAEAKKAAVPEEVRHAIELVGLGWKGCVGACNSEL